ncbi:hypothetical protein E1B28_009132 [Marasmius oreades]|uniref:Uncharacterized protein n=1 Tax=Marasmius oreades TaxID=181124 RepID=A0A9P7RZU8_9AGAR|nr:uncharacterized protein E1B28_009132 [Marasmius oreades]KAG7092816.1 hypothetical protein E1B28_009132 [Marasmius oreades]
MNYDLNTYIAITLAPGSSFSRSPVSLTSVHPALAHMGQVGELIDVQLVSVPKSQWNTVGDDILASLRSRSSEGVVSVEIQQPRQRVKRGGDEL